MKFILCFLLLTGLQGLCHQLPGHHEEQEQSGDKNPPEPQHQPPAERQETETTSFKKIVIPNAEYAFRLYKLIASDPSPQNVIFSPLSISTAFAMLMLGAKNETHRQLFNGLAFDLSDAEENEIHGAFNQVIHTLNQPNNITKMDIGNALFIEESWKLDPKFLNNVKTLYEADCLPTCFRNTTAAENKINDYVKNKTNGKIPQAIQGLDESTAMVLLNYIFFKACWRNPFSFELTTETDFFVDATTTVKVNMMYRKGDYDFLQDEDLSCWVVRVPYNEDYTAWFILPDQGKLKAVENALSRQVFQKWMTSVKMK
uniref:Uncharacterized protein n=1 Tax=Sphaerodactylus townsendi TaxID=933632 RepID=A0ACB8G594_9SAUR